MNELIAKVDKLKETLDNTKEVKEITKLNKEIMKDKELLKLVEEYQKTQDESIKEKIIHNPLFKEYKKKETDLNLIILEINQKLKEITGKRNNCQ